MNVITGQDAPNDLYAVLSTDLLDDLPRPKLQGSAEDFEPVLRRPDDVITVIENAVFAGVILHDFILPKCEPCSPSGGSHFGRIKS